VTRGNLLVGTSGFAYKEWKPELYPEDLPQRKFLEFYASVFPSVEINVTFYRMPTASQLEKWMRETTPAFNFALKASQRITHIKRLRDCDEELTYFLNVAKTLGDRLGPILFQCPPNFKHDQARLEEFVASLPGKPYRFAFEFRHDSWANDEVFELLASNGCAWCVSDMPEKPAPMRQTAKQFVYLRLRGVDYDQGALDRWFSHVDSVLEAGSDAYVYFKHEDDPSGVRYAKQMLTALSG
jgi:uncharacterized protein YecE (DUF72 family)